jgi:hypothetical protein
MSNLNQFTGALLKFNKNQLMGFSSPDTEAKSAAFHADTVAIMVSCRNSNEKMYIKIGDNPTATEEDFFLGAAWNSNGSNGAPIFGPIGVTAGQKLSAYSTGEMRVHIMELKY